MATHDPAVVKARAVAGGSHFAAEQRKETRQAQSVPVSSTAWAVAGTGVQALCFLTFFVQASLVLGACVQDLYFCLTAVRQRALRGAWARGEQQFCSTPPHLIRWAVIVVTKPGLLVGLKLLVPQRGVLLLCELHLSSMAIFRV